MPQKQYPQRTKKYHSHDQEKQGAKDLHPHPFVAWLLKKH